MTCSHCASPNTQRRGTRRGQQRYQCNECRRYFSVDAAAEASTYVLPKREAAALAKGDRFVITCAQNNTPVNTPFWGALKRYATELGAQLIVVPVLYRNPTSRLDPQEGDEDVWWPSEVEPYLIENELELHPKLRLLGDVRVQATAAHPLTGLESLTGAASGIVGHPQIAMRTIATPQQAFPKIMHTTGSCSVKNYSQTKTGKKGWFHHSNGALVAEKEGGRFHLRILNASRDGSFFDLRTLYRADEVTQYDRIPYLVTGDEHAGYTDPTVLETTYYGENSIVAQLRPRVIVRHDVFDGATVNPHEAGDVFHEFARWVSGRGGVEAELELCREHLVDTTPPDTENVVVASNHDDFLRRWLRDTKRPTPENSIVYHELMAAVLRATRMGDHGLESPSPFSLWMKANLPVDFPARFLRTTDSYMLNGVELAMHGHLGPNGARGSLTNLAKIGVKSMFGHGHGPGILWGAYQVGTSSWLRLGYNAGPSSWLHTHGIGLPNGKRQLLNLIDGRWRA